MLVLSSGQAGAKLIGFLTLPLISRIYSPSDFGYFSVFINLVSVLVPFLTLRYVIAIPLPKSDRSGANLLFFCLTLILANSLLMIGCYLLFGRWFVALLNVNLSTDLVVFAVIVAAFSASYEVMNFWATRIGNFSIQAKTFFFQSIVGAALKILAGLVNPSSSSLILGQCGQVAFGCFGIALASFRSLKKHFKSLSRSRIVFLSRRYIDMPKYRLASQVLLVLSTSMPVFGFSLLFGQSLTGQLALTIMTLNVPVQLLATNMGKAYFSEIANLGKDKVDEIRAITFYLIKRMFLIAIIPTTALILFGRELFQMVFGDNWVVAGQYAQILAVVLVAQFITTPLVHVMTVFEEQRKFLFLNLVRFIAIFSVFIVSDFLGFQDFSTLYLFSVVISSFYLVVLFSIIFSIKKV